MDKTKDEIMDRINILRNCIGESGPIDRLENHFLNEIQFLENLLKLIERSGK